MRPQHPRARFDSVPGGASLRGGRRGPPRGGGRPAPEVRTGCDALAAILDGSAEFDAPDAGGRFGPDEAETGEGEDGEFEDDDFGIDAKEVARALGSTRHIYNGLIRYRNRLEAAVEGIDRDALRRLASWHYRLGLAHVGHVPALPGGRVA